MILVDTSVWVDYFRRPDTTQALELRHLLTANQVLATGIIISEVLQGARDERELATLYEGLQALPLLEPTVATWRKTGELGFQLRQAGRGIPLIDSLIATLALEGEHGLFTRDEHFRRVPSLHLHEP